MSTAQAVSATRSRPKGIRPYLPGRRVGEPLCDVPSASLLARRTLRLFYACDRVDGLPEGRIRDEAMADLLERVVRFQQEELPDQKAALEEAMAMMA
jgi:hypothetical protein